jgi:hypothetical protein
MRYAYADPPYIGQAKRHYSNDPSGIPAQEVDHKILIEKMCGEFPDGWALSLSAPTLREILNMCPTNVRVGVWVKSYAVFRPGVNPGYCYEPVIFYGGRAKRSRKEPTVRDWICCSITMRKGTHGAKPEKFCHWIFDMLGLLPGDYLFDLFPGSGAVADALQTYPAHLAERGYPWE